MTVTQITQFLKISPKMTILLFSPLAIISAVLGFWAQQRGSCVELMSGDPTPNPAYVGSAIDLRWVIDVRTRGCSGSFIRVMEQPGHWIWATREFPMTFTYLQSGVNRTHSSEPLIVPQNVDPGVYDVYVIMKFFRNPLQRWLNWPVIDVSPVVKLDVVLPPIKDFVPGKTPRGGPGFMEILPQKDPVVPGVPETKKSSIDDFYFALNLAYRSSSIPSLRPNILPEEMIAAVQPEGTRR
jgi:hypothetical protein